MTKIIYILYSKTLQRMVPQRQRLRKKRYKSLPSFRIRFPVKNHEKIGLKAFPNRPKSWLEASKMDPGGSKIDPEALQDAIFERHLT